MTLIAIISFVVGVNVLAREHAIAMQNAGIQTLHAILQIPLATLASSLAHSSSAVTLIHVAAIAAITPNIVNNTANV